MMVIYFLVKFEFNWTKRFELESGNGNVDGQTKRRNYTNFEMNLAMMVIYLPVKLNSIGHSVFELESGNRNVDGQTNGQKTDKRTDGITPISKGT